MFQFESIPAVPLAVVAAAAGIAAVTDVWRYKVYNALTLPLMLSGLLFYGINHGMNGLRFSACGLLCGFTALIALYALGGFGAGDVKLMAGIGAWIGPTNTLSLFIASSLLAGVCAVVLCLRQRRLRERLIAAWLIVQQWRSRGFRVESSAVDALERAGERPDRRQRLLPFAAVVAGSLIVLVMFFPARS